MCGADECMAWRWAKESTWLGWTAEQYHAAYAGGFGAARWNAIFMPDGAQAQKDWYELNSKAPAIRKTPTGYCGLVGKPE